MRTRVMPALLCVAGLTAFWPGFMSLAPNRLTGGVPVRLAACAPAYAIVIAACLAVFAISSVFRSRLALAAAIALALAVLMAAGQAATSLLASAPHAARAQLGGGFWLLLIVSALAVMDARAATRLPPWQQGFAFLCLAAGACIIAISGQLGAVSLAQEYSAHQTAFGAASARHVLLVAITLAGAAAIGIPLGVAAWQKPRWRPVIFSTLNVIQTLPSIALFGLLMAPLARLGLSGIGIVPACIALILYALLPTARAIVSGLDGVPSAPLRAATGLGLSPWQVFVQLRLPLASPALLAGLRVVVVQTVGLAVVAALIGAGGFGDFVFQGLGQYALDLVLLGALPATALALAADAILTQAAAAAGRRAA
jgi:osmoprotectant transport system permease protein